jgi:hypothetical protein
MAVLPAFSNDTVKAPPVTPEATPGLFMATTLSAVVLGVALLPYRCS